MDSLKLPRTFRHHIRCESTISFGHILEWRAGYSAWFFIPAISGLQNRWITLLLEQVCFMAFTTHRSEYFEWTKVERRRNHFCDSGRSSASRCMWRTSHIWNGTSGIIHTTWQPMWFSGSCRTRYGVGSVLRSLGSQDVFGLHGRVWLLHGFYLRWAWNCLIFHRCGVALMRTACGILERSVQQWYGISKCVEVVAGVVLTWSSFLLKDTQDNIAGERLKAWDSTDGNEYNQQYIILILTEERDETVASNFKLWQKACLELWRGLSEQGPEGSQISMFFGWPVYRTTHIKYIFPNPSLKFPRCIFVAHSIDSTYCYVCLHDSRLLHFVPLEHSGLGNV